MTFRLRSIWNKAVTSRYVLSDGWLRDYRDIPVIINNYNRLSDPVHLLAWLRRAGTRRIVIVDNASDYPPLLAWYATLGGFSGDLRVIRLASNIGAKAIWDLNLLQSLSIFTEYVYTDSDVIPANYCPFDAIGHLQAILKTNISTQKVGLGLRLDNLPANYRHRDAVLLWEQQFWRRPAAPGLMFAEVDTTFALYRPQTGHQQSPDNLRTTWPYVAEHRGWYSDSANATEEDAHYARTARRDVTSWSGGALRDELAKALPNIQRPSLLQLHNGRDAWPGWDQGDGKDFSELETGSYDGFYLSGLPASLATMATLHRLAKPNARMLITILDPHFQPRQALLFGQPDHEGAGTGYSGDWAISRIHRFTDGRWLVHLFAVKPARLRIRSLEVWHEPEVHEDRLSPEPVFNIV